MIISVDDSINSDKKMTVCLMNIVMKLMSALMLFQPIIARNIACISNSVLTVYIYIYIYIIYSIKNGGTFMCYFHRIVSRTGILFTHPNVIFIADIFYDHH